MRTQNWPAEAIWEAVAPALPGFTVEVLPEVDSTNTELMRRARAGQLDPVLLVTERQTAGRGRMNRPWLGEPGDALAFSLGIPLAPLDWSGLSLAAGVAVAESLQAQGSAARLGLKWPNDLVARKDGRLVKLGGILGEQSGARLILGLGVNLLSAPHIPERAIPPACLKDLGLACPDPALLAISILHVWNNLEQDPQVLFRWPEAETPIRWEDGEGTCLGWERDGRLKVATADGIRRLSAGDVSGLS